MAIAVLLVEWAMIINVNRPLMEPKSAKILAVIFAIILMFGAFGIIIWI